MGERIIKQPDGLFVVFDTDAGEVILAEADEETLVWHFTQEAAAKIKKDVEHKVGFLRDGQPEKAYFQAVITWEQVLEADLAFREDWNFRNQAEK